MKGIDVSQHEGKINWNIVKNEIDFAILRLGYIGNNENKLDTQFEYNYAECKRLGIPVGIYVFNYVRTSQRAKQCAEWVCSNLQGKTLELSVYIDMENDDNSSYKISNLGKATLTNIVIAFNDVIAAKGFKPGVYANRNWFDNYLDKDVLKSKYNTWIAHYGVDLDKYKGEYNLLQYSEKGRINGISSEVDLDVMYDSIPTPQPIPQEYAFEQFVTDVQIACGLTGKHVDGKPGPETLEHTITVSTSTNKYHSVVTALERYLKQLGYYKGEIEADFGKTPIFGNGMKEAVMKFQQANNLKVVDGIITAHANTWKKLLNLM